MVVEENSVELVSALESLSGYLAPAEQVLEMNHRPAVLDSLSALGRSRYDLGKALFKYKKAFKKEKIWVQVCRLIGKELGRTERTVFRIIEDYERVVSAPEDLIAAMKREGFDPSAPKNAKLLEQSREMLPKQAKREEASAIVRQSAEFLRRTKQGRRIESRTDLVWAIRKAIRTLLSNVEDAEKPVVLSQAISEEVWDVWGYHEPFSLEITPRPGRRSLGGWLRSDSNLDEVVNPVDLEVQEVPIEFPNEFAEFDYNAVSDLEPALVSSAPDEQELSVEFPNDAEGDTSTCEFNDADQNNEALVGPLPGIAFEQDEREQAA